MYKYFSVQKTGSYFIEHSHFIFSAVSNMGRPSLLERTHMPHFKQLQRPSLRWGIRVRAMMSDSF